MKYKTFWEIKSTEKNIAKAKEEAVKQIKDSNAFFLITLHSLKNSKELEIGKTELNMYVEKDKHKEIIFESLLGFLRVEE
ncbi:MAG: hypothetical protein ABIH25_05710 [Candidatus Woesearchaeota archaeon]